jgi:hypothetical protein
MIGTILGILGVIITIGFGIYSIWTYKKGKRTVSLSFQKKECYSLFKDDVNRLNIELSYNSKPLTSSLILFKARIENNGQVDIDKSRVYRPLKLISSNNFLWLEARITSQPDNVRSKIEIISPSDVVMEWDLLKSQEFIEIEALVEIEVKSDKLSDDAIEFYDNLKFDYRITDLRTIQKEKPRSNISSERLFLFMGIFFILFGLLSTDIVPRLNPASKYYEIYYSVINNKSGKNEIFQVDALSCNELKLKYPNNNKDVKTTISKFNIDYKIVKIVNVKDDTLKNTLNKVLGYFMLLTGCFTLLLRIYVSILRKKRKKKK